MSNSTPANRLKGETSPYLLQHAHNPVHWHPWDSTALELAVREDRPILLSIGYSACHWCHVMAHESFENPQIAELMNRLFVNIKVDREERPDLDKIYQTTHHLLTRRPGGWPLTVFLTPDEHTPFFTGTYFPPTPRHGLPGFPELLENVAEFYRTRRGEITRHGDALRQALTQLSQPTMEGDVFSERPLQVAGEQLLEVLDPVHGGFGGAPKFPHLSDVEWLLRQSARPGADPERAGAQRQAALFSLRQMARGGLHDQLGGGFYRYSTDEAWQIPHFEKMLYDNGPFLWTLSLAWQLEPEPLFRRAVLDTADWALREMQAPEGGFYSSLDADSEGEEGRFYLWERREVKQLLSAEHYAVLGPHLGLEQTPNFEGRWHLRVDKTRAELAEALDMPREKLDELLDAARRRLFDIRIQRVWPGRDDKILTSWNALMIKGLAVAGETFGREDYLEAGQRAVDFLREHAWRDGRLRATSKNGQSRLNAYLDDYAYLMDALLALLQARWRRRDLEFAIELAEVLLEVFEDPQQGGFYFTSEDHEALIQRPKPFGDESVPAGNGVAALALGRLGHLLGETRYLAAAERTLRAAWSSLSRLPHAHASLLMALEEFLRPPRLAVIRADAHHLPQWLAAIREIPAPQGFYVGIPNEEEELPGLLAQRATNGPAVAYVCRGTECHLPVRDLAALGDAWRLHT